MSKRRFKPGRSQRTEKRTDDAASKRPFDGQAKKTRPFNGQNREPAFKKIEYPEYTCTKCGEIIQDLSSAIADKESGLPVHFDCVIEFLKNAEELKTGEEIIYIGNGNFAVAYFENPKIRKNFKIIKLIEWEDKNKLYQWKKDISELTSKT
ncbi:MULTISPECIES: hypothetical protein [unclassified Treponema]|uniref:hypothetical protein n=1 Tax=unclassified Treponema TaxID=2638727 RepID=UPI0020A4653E|nr:MULTISPECIES: hypothetical protein [unclassified Treponema]UTC66082.1 hypothetical protein E4O06_08610 [Treponema sp. OMZ 789]UTC68812.1 hypothetical protein E4O01_08750 [Treponema sp. OMZ 790]UTC71540.1 hypothetical protein E4O02_08940 [Treponema sp. OMZ 791]